MSAIPSLLLAVIAAAQAAPVHIVVQEVGGEVHLTTGTRESVRQQQILSSGDRLQLVEGANITVALVAAEPPGGTVQEWHGPAQLITTREGIRGRPTQLSGERPLDTWGAVSMLSVAQSLKLAATSPEGLRGDKEGTISLTEPETRAIDEARSACEASEQAADPSVQACMHYAGLLLATGQVARARPVLAAAAERCSDCTVVQRLAAATTSDASAP